MLKNPLTAIESALYWGFKRYSSAKITITLLIIFAFAAPSSLLGQTIEPSMRRRILDEPFRLTMDDQVPTGKRMLFDWGGWFRSDFWSIDENVRRDPVNRPKDVGEHAYWRQQLRVWGLANIDQVHQVYGRMKLDYWDWNDSYDNNDSDWEGADLDRGWYDFRLSRYQMAYGEIPGDFDFAARIGRQYVELGTGLALSMPLDAIMLSGYYQNFKLTALGALSIPGTYNIDRSVPGNTKESRRYWGFQFEYNGWKDHDPFIYYLNQIDDDAGRVFGVDNQTFGYDSQYVGLGSRGRFFCRDLQYSLEGVFECGNSYADTTATGGQFRQHIRAWAFDSELRYVVPNRRRTMIALEYLLASGDSDRNGSPTNTIGGNRPGTDDLSFAAWGFRNTGLNFAPLMSNLGMVRLGASTFPMENTTCFKDLELGTNLYAYHKQKSGGAASDTLSTKDSSYLGSEFDIYANWWITSDLSFTTHYGLFLPGDAFAKQSNRHLFYTALTLSF